MMKRIVFLLTALLIMVFHSEAQIIEEFRIDGLKTDSIKKILGSFLYKNMDAGSVILK
jgi:hypothetical protein